MSDAADASRSEKAFEHAKAKIKKQMSPEEFKRLQEISDLDHPVKEAQRICKELQTETAAALDSRIYKLAIILEPFERILQGVCKLSPKGGDLIWGSVSFILEKVKGNVNVLEQVLSFFTELTEEIDHLKVVEDTFDGSHMVVSVIEEVYIAIFEFWVEAVGFYNKTSRLKGWFSGSIDKKFAKLKEKIVTQKRRLHEVEATQYYVNDKFDRVRRQQKEFTKWIDAPNCEEDLIAANEHRYEGTCEWFREKREYQDWMTGQTSALLVICGTAGFGKTILSSWLINEAQSRPAQHITLYHFFKEMNTDKNTALAATRSLLDQVYNYLISTNHVLLRALETELGVVSRKNHANYEQLWKAFASLLHQYSQLPHPNHTFTVTIILDAMDECTSSRKLVQNIRKLVHAASNKIHVAITTRRSGDHMDEFQRNYADQALPTTLELTKDDVKDDISAFVAHSVSQIERLNNPKHLNLRDRITTVFSDVRNHQGMFLWAYLMCKEVGYQLHVSGIWKLLEQLPRDLGEMYRRICKRLSTNEERSNGFGRHILQWVVASRRPMTFVELEEALKVSTTNDNDSLGFSDENGLLWSRKDIVRSCGDLVRYTGLDDDDVILIVHLSAYIFLTTHPSQLSQQAPVDILNVVGSFLVDIPSTELKMAISCVKYILSTSSHSDTYFSPPVRFGTARTSGQKTFKKQFPLFNYATTYWPVYALQALRSQLSLDNNVVQQLLTAIAEFTHSSVSIIWLEELIRRIYVDDVLDIIRQFIKLDSSLIPAEVLRWLGILLKTLLDFKDTLSLEPRMIRTCILQSQSVAPIRPTSVMNGAPPLEADDWRGWIYHNPVTNTLFSATTDSAPALKCQEFQTGTRFQPLLASPESTYQGAWRVHSAAVSARADFIAVTYRHDAKSRSGYLTTCWALNETPSVDDWATIVLNHYSPDERNMFSGCVVAFGKDETLITPGGIFSLRTKQRVAMPSAIYDPDPTFRIANTQFSGQSERVARIRDDALEVLNFQGTSICRHEFGGSQKLDLKGFSSSGSKVVVGTKDGTLWLICFLVDEAKQIDMPFERDVQHAIFTRDERRIVAVVRGCELVVWTLSQDGNGSCRDHADITHTFTTFGTNRKIVFGLTPRDFFEDALIVEENGSITQRPLNLEWSPDELEVSWSLTRNNSFSELVTIWFVQNSDALTVEKWSLESSQSKFVSHIEGPMPDSFLDLLKSSPDGRLLATSTAVIHATPTGLRVLKRGLPREMSDAAFSMDGKLFACLDFPADNPTLRVFDISKERRFTRRASFTFDNPASESNLSFSSHNSNSLIANGCVVRLQGRRLSIQHQTDEVINGFSDCGLYYYDLNYKFYPISGSLDTETPLAMELKNPILMNLGSDYVYSPHILRLRESSNILYLEHKLISETKEKYRLRIIGVLPDLFDGTPADGCLIWPEEDGENLKLMVILKGAPMVMDTGIKKGDLMKEDEWF